MDNRKKRILVILSSVSVSVEDEEHFLLDCCMYGRERMRMYEEIRKKCEIDLEKDYKEKDEMLKMMIGDGLEGNDEGKEMKKVVSMYIVKF